MSCDIGECKTRKRKGGGKRGGGEGYVEVVYRECGSHFDVTLVNQVLDES